MNEQETAHQVFERRLVVENLAKGVEMPDVCRIFKRSPEDVMRDFNFAVRKIRSYTFERRMNAFNISTVEQARAEKQLFLFLLDRVNLAKEPKFPKIKTETLDETTMKKMGLIT